MAQNTSKSRRSSSRSSSRSTQDAAAAAQRARRSSSRSRARTTNDAAAAASKVRADAANSGDGATQGEGDSNVATAAENARLEHSQGGVTTRDDLLDAGVPVEQGTADEPQGPEDALGRGEKRGDYRDRIVGQPHESVPVEGGGEAVTAKTKYTDANGKEHTVQSVVDRKPGSRLEPQRPRAEEIGNSEPGKKGGVTTAGNPGA